MLSVSRKVGYVLTILVAVMLLLLGALLITGLAPYRVTQTLAMAALLQHRTAIGAVAIAAAMFLLAPGTLPIGAVLTSSLLGGLVTVHLVAEQSIVPPLIILLVTWLGAGLRSDWLQRLSSPPATPGASK